MPELIKGARATFISLIVLTLCYVCLIHNKSLWQPNIDTVSALTIMIFSLSLLLSFYFKRTRLAFITALWGSYYYLDVSSHPLAQQVLSHSELAFLIGVSIHLLIANIKERAIVSIHTLKYFALIIVASIIAVSWFYLANLASIAGIFSNYQVYLSIELPLVLVAIQLLYLNLSKASLSQVAISISLLIWTLTFYQVINLPLAIMLAVLLSYNLIVIIIDCYHLAFSDELTGLPSRRALNQYSMSLGSKYSVAMLDIDHFKKFNDTYGHDVGDQVLKLVASKLSKVKCNGKTFRYGGEEFAIVFARKNQEQVLDELERIRKLIANYKMVIRQQKRQSKDSRNNKPLTQNKTVKVTISIGVSERKAKQKFEQALKLADQALYKAKKAGRNNVSF